ncbi:hypothetical protein Q5P01_009836 [Channa striata]|uniref:Uncharacterized protein n=1 Tax=Channa striata TaxID=64152 RepID=A0AA88SXU2_CHASR|nr:hypothetical protein Q5P01_009836 [Channa striata]
MTGSHGNSEVMEPEERRDQPESLNKPESRRRAAHTHSYSCSALRELYTELHRRARLSRLFAQGITYNADLTG